MIQYAMNQRLDAIHGQMADHKLAHLLITDPVDVTYISGFESSNAALLIGKRSDRIITDFRYTTAVEQFCKKHPEWKHHIISSSMADSITSFLSPQSRVGFQSNHCTVDEFKKLKKNARTVFFITASKLVDELLQSKLPHEINAMKRAAAIGDKALHSLLKDIHSGITERQCAQKLESYCSIQGSEKPSFDTIVLFGENAALPHGHPGDRKLKKGDIILIDFGCTVDGFASDMTRTLFFGKAPRQHKKQYAIVLEAQLNACKHAKAGMTGKEIDALARSVIEAGGYGDSFGHALGHGVGRRIHESPRISSHNSRIVHENSVITIEPGMYIPGSGGIRIEDMGIIRKDGIEILTNFTKELIEL